LINKDFLIQNISSYVNFIILASFKLREHLLEGSDYKLISEKGWNKLLKWFGMVDGQKSLRRYVIEHGLYVKETKVEIYPLEMSICLFRKVENVIPMKFSKTTTLG